jgi:hypothetical protein
MRDKIRVILIYLVLLALALPIPLLHHYRTDQAIEARRPVMQHDDGSYTPMLMPSHILLLRWLGELSRVVPLAVIVSLTLSFFLEIFRRPSVLCAVAIGECAFATLYACYGTFVLGLPV